MKPDIIDFITENKKQHGRRWQMISGIYWCLPDTSNFEMGPPVLAAILILMQTKHISATWILEDF